MVKVRFTRRAEADLHGISEYTWQNWGAVQERAYLGELESCCIRLAAGPLLGRACDEVRPGLRRMEQGRHVVFYRPEGKGILVVRALHQSMVPSRWSMAEDAE
jgi:toxin ParE1/3/4